MNVLLVGSARDFQTNVARVELQKIPGLKIIVGMCAKGTGEASALPFIKTDKNVVVQGLENIQMFVSNELTQQREEVLRLERQKQLARQAREKKQELSKRRKK